MTGHHDVGRGLSGAGEREGSPKASAKDGPGGAHVCAIYVRIRDGVSSDRRALCATGWLGGTRRGRAWKTHLTPSPLALFQDGKAFFLEGKVT